MRFARKCVVAGLGALVVCAAINACTYDFDSLVAHTGSAGVGGAGGLAGSGGLGGESGSDDGGDIDGSGGAAGSSGAAGSAGSGGTGMDGSAGKGGTSGTGGTAVDAGKGGTAGTAVDAGKGGTGMADAAPDRGPDAIADVRSEPAFDCTAVNGTVFGGHCYYLSSATTSWDTANTTGCVAPSHLAVITSAGEQGIVAAILPGKDRWIGMRKDVGSPNMKSSLHWITMEAITYELWDSYETGAPEPNFTGDCVRMSPTDKWGDNNCASSFAAVCEHE